MTAEQQMEQELQQAEDKRVIKLTLEQINAAPKKHDYTEEEMQREYDYLLAQQMLEKLLDSGLISREEFNKITQKNRQTFSPKLAELMP